MKIPYLNARKAKDTEIKSFVKNHETKILSILSITEINNWLEIKREEKIRKI